jgi:LytS/YehU family sensor histidine kinase
VIEVIDDGSGLQEAWGAGIGLANIGARLHSRYGDRASLSLTNGSECGAVAMLRLPAETAGAPA